MTQWKLTLSYDGTAFHGWQVQPGLRTIQSALAQAILHVTGETVLPQGSGRTDAGVHALAQVATVALTTLIPAQNLQHALNRALPPAIRVLAAQPVPPTFHARHSALAKTYEYRIFRRSPTQPLCPPFLAPFVWDCRWPLALAPMQQAAHDLLGTHDFTSFAAADPDLTQRTSARTVAPEIGPGFSPDITWPHKSGLQPPRPSSLTGPNPIKQIHTAAWHLTPETLTFRIHGSGFLHHMVRNIVGTLADIGRGALTPNAIPQILAARSRPAAGPTAPAQGLFLIAVDYPEDTENPTA